MNKSNILTEGVLDFIIKMVLKGQHRKLQKIMKANPELYSRTNKFTKAFDELQTAIKKSKKSGKKIPSMKFDL